MHVTIVKYKDYQDQDNYKSHTEATAKPQKSHTKSKERKKEEINIA
jgi:deferrochelatase/peroxidase EfeB